MALPHAGRQKTRGPPPIAGSPERTVAHQFGGPGFVESGESGAVFVKGAQQGGKIHPAKTKREGVGGQPPQRL